MAGAPWFKVYTAEKKYVASTKDVFHAALLMYGPGYQIRAGHQHVVWHEGHDGTASESYDKVIQVVWDRIDEARAGLPGRS